jgi:NADH:ubiquinone oxidoreductase subunit 6 (subunit J)
MPSLISPLLAPIGLCMVMGLVAVYLLLPRPRRYPVLWGGAAGGVAMVLAGSLLVRTGATVEAVLFYAYAGIAVVAGGLLVTQTRPARAALSFALVVLSTCGLFLLQAAPFLMAATTIIYAGAILVTFLFVLMLAQQEGPSDADCRSREPFLASAAGFALLGTLLYVLFVTYDTTALDALWSRLRQAQQQATADQMGEALSEAFFDGLDRVVQDTPLPPELRSQSRDEIMDLEFEWHQARRLEGSVAVEAMTGVLDRTERLITAIRGRVGDLQPGRDAALSGLSGPRSNRDVPHDARGNAPLPAENVAHLGRALFTDYLLAVEVAGTLLLVATIGAIVIATRRDKAAS